MDLPPSVATETRGHYERSKMVPANSKNKDELQARRERAREAIEAYSTRFERSSSAGEILVRKGQHLDVDGILARSLPQTFIQSSSFKAETKAGR
jgi:hypothetical protein